MRGSRETLGKGSLCERAALAIADQVEQVLEFLSHPFWDVFPEIWHYSSRLSILLNGSYHLHFVLYIGFYYVGKLSSYTCLVSHFFAQVAFGDSVQSLEIPGSLKEVSLKFVETKE